MPLLLQQQQCFQQLKQLALQRLQSAQTSAVSSEAPAPSLLPPTSTYEAPPALPPLQAPRSRVALTSPASHLLFLLHSGDIESRPPIDNAFHEQLVRELQLKAHATFGMPLPPSLAVSAIEVARHSPLSRGPPTVDGALSCLEATSARLSTLPPLRPLGNFEPLHPATQRRRVDDLNLASTAPSAPMAPAPTSSNMFIRRAQQSSAPPAPLSNVNSEPSLLSGSARFRRSRVPLESRQLPGRVHACTSCGDSGHAALFCPHGVDVAVAVDAARELGQNCQAGIRTGETSTE
jgi:hypothetical protein